MHCNKTPRVVLMALIRAHLFESYCLRTSLGNQHPLEFLIVFSNGVEEAVNELSFPLLTEVTNQQVAVQFCVENPFPITAISCH